MAFIVSSASLPVDVPVPPLVVVAVPEVPPNTETVPVETVTVSYTHLKLRHTHDRSPMAGMARGKTGQPHTSATVVRQVSTQVGQKATHVPALEADTET